ncbi:MAG: acetolactate synthase large subunit [Pseudomonadota bacterium]
MNGAESLARTLVACGLDTCFANPGTSEMHFVSALDRVEGLHCVLGLAETVVTGAADGFGRMAKRPAATLLHCAPGLANGIANLHNAKRAYTPIVNIVGDHATYHRQYDSPLTGDTVGIAKGVSRWLRVSASAMDVAADGAAAVQASLTAPGGIATLVLPADTAWNQGSGPAAPLAVPARAKVPAERVREAAVALRSGAPAMLLLAGVGLSEEGLKAAHRIAAATGARLSTPTQVSRMARGRGRPSVDRVPYVVDRALAYLGGLKHMVLCGSKPPVAFFAYPGKLSLTAPPDCAIHPLATVEEDVIGALEMLADELGAPRKPPIAEVAKPATQRGPFQPEAFGLTLGALMPENAVVCEEGATSGRALFPVTWGAAPHDWLQLTGGAIGHGLACAAGAAVAARDRKIIALQSDGGAMYQIQALWTQAREKLDVVNVIFANRRYAILQGELAAVGATPGPAANQLFDLTRPELNFVAMAAGMGVEGVRVENLEGFADAFGAACGRRGPFLIEFLI